MEVNFMQLVLVVAGACGVYYLNNKLVTVESLKAGIHILTVVVALVLILHCFIPIMMK